MLWLRSSLSTVCIGKIDSFTQTNIFHGYTWRQERYLDHLDSVLSVLASREDRMLFVSWLESTLSFHSVCYGFMPGFSPIMYVECPEIMYIHYLWELFLLTQIITKNSDGYFIYQFIIAKKITRILTVILSFEDENVCVCYYYCLFKKL